MEEVKAVSVDEEKVEYRVASKLKALFGAFGL